MFERKKNPPRTETASLCLWGLAATVGQVAMNRWSSCTFPTAHLLSVAARGQKESTREISHSGLFSRDHKSGTIQNKDLALEESTARFGERTADEAPTLSLKNLDGKVQNERRKGKGKKERKLLQNHMERVDNQGALNVKQP